MRGLKSGAGWSAAAFAAGLVAAAGAVRAQQEGPEWDLQRCVWSCLSAFGPADNPAYAACVSRNCSEPTAPAPAPRWSSGATSDGHGAYAGVRAEGGQDVIFYVFCARDGERLLQLDGVGGEAGPNVLSLTIDGQGFPVTFGGSSEGGMLARLPPSAAVLGALQRGQMLEIRSGTGQGQGLGRFPLAGAGDAISGALALCR
ncbi:hypothetical protein [Rhodovulum sulfidophilum]|uniref:hypothetical protein n=1 Tax=Rhodovulum sulfidophilum TaxID=35806 RepID=UPI001913900C|nr:hypothetical protein [Rhodovulum sulfidophilum]